MKIKFDNLIDVSTGKAPVVYGCGCDECAAKYERIKEMGRQAAERFKANMRTEDQHAFDNDVDLVCGEV